MLGFIDVHLKSRLWVGNEAKEEKFRKVVPQNMSEPKQLQIQVEGLENLMETLQEHEGKKIFVMFIGSMLEEGDHIGESWCPDCRDGKAKFSQLDACALSCYSH